MEQSPATRTCPACGKRTSEKSAHCAFCGARGDPAPNFAAIAESAITSSRPFVSLTWHPASALALDLFFDLTWGADGLAPNDDAWQPTAGQYTAITSLGAFFGELIRREMGGTWQSDDQHADVLHARLVLPGGTQLYPFSRAWKRMKTGASESFDTLFAAARSASATQAAPHEAQGWVEHAKNFEAMGRFDLASLFCDRACAVDPDAASLQDTIRIRALARESAAPAQPVAALQTQSTPPSAPTLPACPAAPTPAPPREPVLVLPADASAAIAQADSLARAGDYAAALAAYDQALALEPAARQALLGRGRALMALARLEEASAWLDALAMRDDCEPERSLLGAAAAQKAGKLCDAHDLLVRVAHNPQAAAAHRERARARAQALMQEPALLAREIERMDDLGAAVQAYQALLATHPGYAEGWRELGVGLCMLNRTQEALPCFERAQTLEPSEPKSYDHRATALARLGQLDDAIAALEQGLQQCPQANSLKFRKGVLLGNAGRSAQALAQLGEVVRDEPTHPDVWANTADIELREGRVPEAIAAIANFLHNNPARIGPRMQAAHEKLWSLRNPGVTRDPDRAQALSDRASHLITEFGDVASALADLDAAVLADPLHGYCWFNRAALLFKAGRVTEALASCEQAEVLLGAIDPICDLQVTILLGLRQADDALRCHARNLARGKPSVARRQAKLATLLQTQRNDEALAMLQMLIAQQPFDSALRALRAQVLVALNRHAQARAAYDAAIALAPADLDLRAERAALDS